MENIEERILKPIAANFLGDVAEPGSVWRHPPGVVHHSEALEDCVQIEVKSPPCRTWD